MAVPCYLVTSQLMARYCLTDSCHCVYTPGTASRVTNASLSTALQAGRSLRHTTQTTGLLLQQKSCYCCYCLCCSCCLCCRKNQSATITNMNFRIRIFNFCASYCTPYLFCHRMKIITLPLAPLKKNHYLCRQKTDRKNLTNRKTDIQTRLSWHTKIS